MRYSFILLAILCTACGTALPTVKPFKLDVQQGNVVTSKMLLQLRPGMTKSQVRFIMGTPLIQDSFHDKRWDYVYQLRENGKITEQRRVILDFESDVLKTVRGDVKPSSAEKAKEGDVHVDIGTRIVKPGVKPEGKGVIDKLKFWENNDASLAKDKSAKDAAEAKPKVDATESTKVPKSNEAPSMNEEPKSMLAVPLEVLPTTEIHTPAVPEVVAPVGTAPVAPPVSAAPEIIAPVVVDPNAAKPNAEALPNPADTKPVAPESIILPVYESPAGMQFDKNLKIAPEHASSESNVNAPRAGNKEVPRPKDLPAEASPGFFDKMLEKIGF